MEEITVRRLKQKDIEKLQTLYSKHLYRYGAYQVRLSLTTSQFWARTVCDRLYIQHLLDFPLRVLELETLVCATAETNNRAIVGTAVARRQHPLAKRWRLGLVVVHSKYRRLGIATRMIEFLFEQLKEKKAEELWLIVNTYSEAKRLYRKLGWKSVAKLYVTYGCIPDLPTQQPTSGRSKAEITVKRIFTRTPYESFTAFWFKKVVSATLRTLLENFPRSDTFLVFQRDKVIGFLKVDNSKFPSVSIVEEIFLHPPFQEKDTIERIFKGLFKCLKNIGKEEVVFQVIRNSVDPLFLRNILLKLNMRRVTTYDLMSRKWPVKRSINF